MGYFCTYCGRVHDMSAACEPPDEPLQLISPYTCPVCKGQKIVSKPPWIAGDIDEWTGSGTETYTCPACKGTGIIWKS